ncbi:MAG: ATP-dependent helicase [Thermoleophilia bacterium]|nr:ATP-dependent helicase [Thermoleophilia bacterium]
MGYPRSQAAPPISPQLERLKTDREAYAPRNPLAAEPSGRKVYRLRPPSTSPGLSERLAEMLDPQQRAAVSEMGDRTLVLAAAGSGKTRVLTAAVAHLVEQGIPARHIMLVTFTRRAAREMTQRAQRLAGVSMDDLTAGTFHSVCQRILRAHGSRVDVPPRFSILDGDDQAELLRMCVDDALAELDTRPSMPRPEWISGVISLAAETNRPLAAVIADQNPRLVDRTPLLEQVAQAYTERKRASSALDYADLLVRTVQLLRDHADVRDRLSAEHRWVLVDELHDTNAPQAAIVELLAAAGSRVFAVADPDQSIYAWRGADPEVVERFAGVPGTRIAQLGANYRSTGDIVDFAQATLPAGNRWDKQLLATRRHTGAAPVVAHCLSVVEEAAFVTQRIADLITDGREPAEIGVLYRAHHHSVELQLALTEAGVEFELHSGSRFVESAHVKDVLAFCRIRHNPHDSLAWHRALRLFDRVGQRGAARGTEAAMAAAGEFADAVAAVANLGAPLKPAAEVCAQVAELERPEDIILHVARSDWYRDSLQARFVNWRDREGDLSRLAEIAARASGLGALLSDLALAERVEVDEDISGPARRVVLSSVHQAKGLEWPVVFVLQVEAGSFPSSWALAEGQLEEEERVFHVAVTRAKDELYLCRPVEAKRPWDTGANRVVMNSGMGFLDRDLGDLVEEWSVR